MKLSAGAAILDKKLKSLGMAVPSFHVVLGSGFKEALEQAVPASFEVKGELSFADVPGLYASTVPGHAGKYVLVEHRATKKTGVLQAGRLHGYEGREPREVIRTVMYSRELGTKTYFVTNAAGGLDPKHQPGDVMLIRDHINFTGRNPCFGENPRKEDGTEWGPRFPDMSRLYHAEWSGILASAFVAQGLRTHDGVYIGVLGPTFETPAEIRFFQMAGAQAVGMSTIWETTALHHSGATVCALSLIGNLGAGLARDASGKVIELDHFAILEVCRSSSLKIFKGLLESIEKGIGSL